MHHAVTALYPGLAVESPSGAYSSARKLKSLLRMTLSFALYGGSRAYQNWRGTHTRLRRQARPFMLTVYSEDHALQDGKLELVDGQLVPCFEMPRRAFLIRDRVQEVGLGAIVPPEPFGRGPIERVHTPDFVEFLATAWERWTGHRPHLRRAALGLAHASSAPDPARADRRADRLLQLRCRHADHRRHLARGAGQRGGGADRRASCSASGQHPAVFALCRPPGPPRRGRSLRRLLLPQQRRDRGAIPDRRRRRAGGDPRRRLSPRQRHPGDLLRPPRRAVPLPARPSARGVPVLPRLGRRDRRRGRARAATSTIRCPGARALPPGPRRWTMPAGKIARLRAGRAAGVARRRHLRGRPDLEVPPRERRLHHLRRAASPSSACRPCS